MKISSKRTLIFILLLSMMMSLIPMSAYAAGNVTWSKDTNNSSESNIGIAMNSANGLSQLRLFKGVGTFADGTVNFDLGRPATRVEALVMLIRLLGKEAEAEAGNWKHPFTDVPAWADKYVGYAYEKGLTKGSTATTFGTGNATAQMYLTFVLRALGYSDAAGGDFHMG